jgi:hypothetical protein
MFQSHTGSSSLSPQRPACISIIFIYIFFIYFNKKWVSKERIDERVGRVSSSSSNIFIDQLHQTQYP